MARYGIIDLGSNTIRLCIYEVEDPQKRPLQKKDIRTLLNYKVMAGLASHVKDGVMTQRGIARAIKTINAHLRRAENFNCEQLDIFATAVIRNCSNSKEAAQAIEAGIGRKFIILSNEEEAHLGFVGAGLDRTFKDGTMVDIGGGSTELTRIVNQHDEEKISIPQGSLSSFAGFTRGLLPTEEEQGRMAQNFKCLLGMHDATAYKTKQLYGIGGAIRSAAKVYGDLFCDGNRSERLLPEHVDAIIKRYRQDPDAFAHQALQTVPDRIHTFIPGCIIIREVFAECGAEYLDICKSGIREGYLAERILKIK